MKNTTWNLNPLFTRDDDPKINVQRKIDLNKSQEFIDKWRDRNDYLSDPKVLKEALDEYENWIRTTGAYDKELYYLNLRTQQEMGNSHLKGLFNSSVDLATKLENEIQFFTLRIAKITNDKRNLFLNHPSLAEYKHFLETLFENAKHELSEAEEKIINLKRQTSHSNWTKMVSSFISQEERLVELEDGTTAVKSFSDISSLLQSQKKSVRDSAAVAMNEILSKHSPVAGQEINSILANKKVDDELRQLPRPDSKRHLSDDIETETVDILLDTVSSKFSVSKRWYSLKAKLLGLPKLAYHERVVEYGQISKEYSFEEASELVAKVLQKLDPEFGEIFEGYLAKGQLDVYPRKDKRGGAFCMAGSISLPTYILLNHTGRFTDVCTLAHEVGHGINNELMRTKQNALNFGSPLSTAEVASTFMEDFVTDEVIRGAEDELKLSILCKKLDDDVATIFRQTACYLFEQELHKSFRERSYLSNEEIGKLFQKHMSEYMGDSVDMSAGSENWWVYWSHIRSFFYVYSYASGLLISKSLQRSVRNDPQFIYKVKQFLSSGTSESPKDIFTKLGVDISKADFWLSGLNEIEDLLDETEKLAIKLGKIN